MVRLRLGGNPNIAERNLSKHNGRKYNKEVTEIDIGSSYRPSGVKPFLNVQRAVSPLAWSQGGLKGTIAKSATARECSGKKTSR